MFYVIKHPWGWFIGIVQQALYLVYALVSHNWGFLFHSTAYTVVYLRNYCYDEKRLLKKRAKQAAKAAKRAANADV